MRVLGLDIGVTSIGWAIVEFDQDAKNEIDKKSNNKIIDLGVRLFDGVAEDRSGKLLAQNWRNSKSSRQRYKRKKERLKAIENEFKSIGFLDNSYNKEQFFAKFHFENKDIFILRAKALEEKLSPKQIFACIYYLAKHRGYRSGPVPQSSKSKSNNKDSVKTIDEIQKTKSLLGYDIDKNSYQKTIAQYVVQNINNSIYRNRDGQVVFMAQKEMIEYEAREILRYQSKFYKEIDDKFVDKIIDIINLKAPAIDEKSINEMIGDCAILKDERRAFKNSITATKSMIFQIINNTIKKYQLDPTDNLYIDAMNIIIKKGKLTFENLNSILSSNITTKDKEKLIDNKATNMLKDICKILNIDNYNDMNNKEDELNELIYIFAIYKDFMHCEEKFAQHLAKYSYTDSQKDEILNLCFNKISGTSNLSLKALKGIEPYLIDGYVYTIACDEYIKHLDDKSKIKANSIKSKYLKVLIKKENPRVRKIVNQAIILINTLIKNGAKFDQINIELARDLPLTTKEEKRYDKSKKRNKENKESAKAIVGESAKNKDILKARLLIEQDYQCPYCNIKLNSSDIFDNKVEIDHILPLSLSFDDSYTNKVLTHKECNQLKGQRIPRSGFLDDEWFVSHINSIPQSMCKRKRDNLLITLDEFEKHIENIEVKDLVGNVSDTEKVSFTIDKTVPIVSGVENGKYYNHDVTITFNEGTATLNGIEFESGETVSLDGEYELIVKDEALNEVVINFVVDKTKPVITGVEDGKYYNHDVTITFNEGTATLNGEEFTTNSVVSLEGEYQLVVKDLADNETVINFVIDKTAPTGVVTPNPSVMTNTDVELILETSEDVMITNLLSSKVYQYEEGNLRKYAVVRESNGDFTFKYVDYAGNTGYITYNVTNIDKEKPETTNITYSPSLVNDKYSKEDVLVTISYNEEITEIPVGFEKVSGTNNEIYKSKTTSAPKNIIINVPITIKGPNGI